MELGLREQKAQIDFWLASVLAAGAGAATTGPRQLPAPASSFLF